MLDPIRDFPWLRAGYEQGVQHGESRGKANGVLAILTSRGIPVSDIERARILANTDLAQLDRWLVQAASAGTAAELLTVS